MIPIVYSILIIFISNLQIEAQTLCSGNNVTSKYVIEYCDQQGGYLIHRCCRGPDNETFIAVDLMDSNLTKIPDFTEHENFDLVVIDLRSNPELEPSHDNDFLALKDLDVLVLPNHFDCPGGQHVWKWINKTDDPIGNLCGHQKDFCSNSTDICTEPNSYCDTNGPTHFLCLCKTGYDGYKCLRKGKFPSGLFYGLSIGVTIVTSAVLYCTQRRHVRN
ncbi:unnamed protein product [Adineta steineri]|uniref:EGF-like domain-containing protein n=3 Tax=Adineta steineri TaxID=433720 RepID=A0A819EJE5_9BILA|nr:unnamed protein product [Adineta steineri]CAF0925225.1 unnamed protein product [Adineta steineri]CAF3585018.1 unnamed protein product [Adineta steineri]CAF3851965.1 unnamed protein product [Adineta steineri]